MLTAILILFLATVAVFYSSRSALFDQRIAGNEERQRAAFAMAEGIADLTTEYLIAADRSDLLDVDDINDPGGASCTPLPGETRCLANWQLCTEEEPICEDAMRSAGGFTNRAYFIHDLGNNDDLPSTDAIGNTLADLTGQAPDLTARVSVVAQFKLGSNVVDVPDTGVQALFIIYGYGYSDCSRPDDIASCQGEASIVKPVADFFALTTPPNVPYTGKSTFNPGGDLTIVAAPNGGGVGVATSTWIDADAGVVYGGGGTWQTCEYDEWYEEASIPDYALCSGQDNNNDGIVENSRPSGCDCNGAGEALTEARGMTQAALDILEDPNFPDDLLKTYFGVDSASYTDLKDSVVNLPNCDSLGPGSSGVYWITGPCTINGGGSARQVGSYDEPVVLIAEAGVTVNGATLFGMVFCTDAPPVEGNARQTINIGGNGVIYGAIVDDCEAFNVNGTFDLVYNAEIIANANSTGGLGAVSAGWRDYDVPAFVPAAE